MLIGGGRQRWRDAPSRNWARFETGRRRVRPNMRGSDNFGHVGANRSACAAGAPSENCATIVEHIRYMSKGSRRSAAPKTESSYFATWSTRKELSSRRRRRPHHVVDRQVVLNRC